ncbi:PREDICTED: adipolin [Bison bison bison]|uniref:Adipolin n=1 Tax=Bison bison bison TaxID=43346 RepID=A0A6P3I9V1_BISBB|nr:PREDICTED: adipolin [Bison bison bison]
MCRASRTQVLSLERSRLSASPFLLGIGQGHAALAKGQLMKGEGPGLGVGPTRATASCCLQLVGRDPHAATSHTCTVVPTEATEHRSLGLLGPVLPEGIGRQLVAEAFHCRLRGPVLVDKKTLVELQGFQAPAAQGAFLRGSGLSLASGRFTAPVTAIFQFSASLHVDPRELQGRVRPRARDTVRVLVCIESLCHRHM